MNTPQQKLTGLARFDGRPQINGPDPLIMEFAQLFQGRWDAVGGDDGRAIYQPYTYDLVLAHLEGIEGTGVYPTWPELDGTRWTLWGCCDIDTGDWSEAFQLATALKGMGLVPHVERSRSKGWHIWVFVEQPIEAWQMRRCLKVAYSAIDLPAKEANPKSEKLGYDQLGNYVRLPYKSGLLLGSGIQRQCMMDGWGSRQDGAPMSFGAWVDCGSKFSDPDKIKYWASKWYERPRKLLGMQPVDEAKVGQLLLKLDQGWRKFYETGEVRDRSSAFVALAYWCAQRQWAPEDVFTLLWFCPWNKYLDRHEGETYVQDIVERAYS